jgi:hypothetical protein
VQALKMPGSKDSETAKEPSEFEKKKMSIEETKRSLPVFPFKQDLIDAVREHQVHFTEPAYNFETGCIKFFTGTDKIVYYFVALHACIGIFFILMLQIRVLCPCF